MGHAASTTALAVALVAACAATTPPVISSASAAPADATSGVTSDATPGATPGATSDAGTPGGPRTAPGAARDLLDLALLASGFDDEGRRSAARADMEGRLRPIVAAVLAVPDPEARPSTLLKSLHREWLRQYDARATTAVELLADGRYNCLSAAVLYNLAAERAGIDASGELLPTHARSIVKLRSGRTVVVEATSPNGFDPDPKTQSAILAQVATPPEAGQRAIVTDRGARVPSLVLAGTIYVNRASLAQETGELARAEQLFARAEALAGTPETKVVLRDQRAALMTQLAATDLLSRDPGRVARAYATMLAVVRLGSSDPAVRTTAEHNTRAAAERMIAAQADAGREDGVSAILRDLAQIPLSPPVGAALRAFAWSEIGRLRAQRGDMEGTLAAIDRGLEAEVGAGDAHLAGVLRENRFATLRRFAMSTAKSGQLERSLEIVRRLESLPGLTPEQREEAAQDRARVFQLGAEARFAAGDMPGAVKLYRQAHALAPADETARHNLVAGLQQITVEAVNAGRCGDVRSELDEIRRVAPADAYPDKADARCLLLEANTRLEANDAAGAVERLRRAQRLRPDDTTVRTNLGLGLLALSRAHLLARDCAASRTALAEAKSLGAAQTAPLETAVGKACPR